MRYPMGFPIAVTVALGAGVTCVAAQPLKDEAPVAIGALEVGGAAKVPAISDHAVLEWNEIAVTTIGAQNSFASTRFMAAVELAVFDAVNAVTGKYEPYLGNVTAPPGASAEAAAIAAAHGVLTTFFPSAAATLDQQRSASLAFIPDGQAKADGIGVGEAAAAAMIAERTGDGSTPAQFHLPTSSDPYEWQPTPSCSPAGGMFVHWANVKPFGVQSSSQFRAEPPPPLTSRRYARDFNEVLAYGDVNSTVRSRHQTDVARLYASQPPHQGWNWVARQIINRRRDEITDTARTLALMNMSLADAHFTVFESKYFYRTWRPETAIPRAGEDGNSKTAPSAFTPLITTPCFPGYPSAHGVGAGAASRILWKAYGRRHVIINSHPNVPGVVFTFYDLLGVVKAVSDARVYGGIHFRADQDAAERQGRSVADWNLDNHLRPR